MADQPIVSHPISANTMQSARNVSLLDDSPIRCINDEARTRAANTCVAVNFPTATVTRPRAPKRRRNRLDEAPSFPLGGGAGERDRSGFIDHRLMGLHPAAILHWQRN